jgi:hypothetical protein
MTWSKKPLKVWNGSDIIEGIQYRLIVAARSRAEASRLTGVSTAQIKKYWSITANEEQIKLAKSKPGTVFICEMNYGNSPWAELITAREGL